MQRLRTGRLRYVSADSVRLGNYEAVEGVKMYNIWTQQEK
jgi:hypothetical protein